MYRRPERMLIDGGDFVYFGYPAEGGLDNRPTGRTIRGYCQRWFSYLDSAGRRYFALEMSCPAPAGLSGSVVAYAQRPDVAVGVVTANHDSYVLLDRVEEVQRDGSVYRGSTSRVISYGIAASLSNTENWLDEHLSSLSATD